MAVLPVLALTVLAAWLLGPGTLPSMTVLSLLVVTAAAVGMFASTRRGAPFAGILGLLIATIPGFAATVDWSKREAGAGPDLIVVSVDALRFDGARSMSAYQRIAAEGVEFTSAQAPAPWTLP